MIVKRTKQTFKLPAALVQRDPVEIVQPARVQKAKKAIRRVSDRVLLVDRSTSWGMAGLISLPLFVLLVFVLWLCITYWTWIVSAIKVMVGLSFFGLAVFCYVIGTKK